MARWIDIGELTIGETAQILSTMFGRTVREFVLLVNVDCGCGRENCEGDQAMISSRSGAGVGHDEPFVLHMIGRAIEGIAVAQRDQGPADHG